MGKTPDQAWTALITQLRNALGSGGALEYVDYVYEGLRDGVTSYPCIVVEPLREPEKMGALLGRMDVKLQVQVVGILKIHDKDLQIVGDATIKGIMDLKNDMAKAITSDHTLGGVVIDTNIIDARYDWSDYPHRSVTLEIEIDFEQDVQTRT